MALQCAIIWELKHILTGLTSFDFELFLLLDFLTLVCRVNVCRVSDVDLQAHKGESAQFVCNWEVGGSNPSRSSSVRFYFLFCCCVMHGSYAANVFFFHASGACCLLRFFIMKSKPDIFVSFTVLIQENKKVIAKS